jgi:hypothetical protein
VTDYNEQFDNSQAALDETDAERLRAESKASFDTAKSELDAVSTDPQRGHPEDADRHLRGAMDDISEGMDFDVRADKLDQAAGLHAASTETFHERDDARAAGERADIAAQGAEMVLDFTDMSESDKTRWLAEKGAREGEAQALHDRDDALTERGIDQRHQASQLEDEARSGLPGHGWDEDKGRGHAPGGPAIDPTTGAPSGDGPAPE